MGQDTALERFRELLQIPTITVTSATDADWSPFDHFAATLEHLYPALHDALIREIVAGHSLLYRWRGTGSGDPTVLMAHYDVVPATAEGWTHPPFAAVVEDGVLWARGALDDKGALVAILEAVERLVVTGFAPANDIYLSFGHDEESEGWGARAIVDLLESRGIRPALVLDEGGAIVEGIFPSVAGPIAVIGVSEKGQANFTLSVTQQGGHASTPPKRTATVRLARAITRLNARPFPAALSPVNLEMIGTLGTHATGIVRVLFTNLRVTRGLVRALFGRLSDETRAIVRTTQAVTRLSGSAAPNVLAEVAQANVNVRIAVGSSIAATLAHLRAAVADAGVEVTLANGSEPSPVSPRSGPGWTLITDSIAAVYPGTIVTPYVMLAASDSRHYTRISDNVYRFSPFRMSGDERATLHARNERVHVDTWLAGIDFFAGVIRGV